MSESSNPEGAGRLGVFACKRALDRLHRYRDLEVHKARWAPDLDSARPLGDLLPGDTKPENTAREIQSAIDRLIPGVTADLRAAGVATTLRFPAGRPVGVTGDLDVILDYQQTVRSVGSFDVLMSVLDRGIGFYEERLLAAKKEAFNPLRWLAWTLNGPVFVLREAGYLAPETKPWVLAVVNAIAWPLLALFVWVLSRVFGWNIPSELLKRGTGGS